MAIAPGVTIKEQLVERGMRQKEFAIRMDLSEKHVSRLINGEVLLTLEVARKLEMVLGIPAQFWCNLETIYREELLKVEEENAMDADIEIAQKMPCKGLEELGWIQQSSNQAERVIRLRKFFEVVRLELLQEPTVNGIVYKRIVKSDDNDYTTMAWIQKVKLEARKIETKPICIKNVKRVIDKIKDKIGLVPQNCIGELKDIFASCGIAFVCVPPVPGLSLQGVTFADGNKIVMGLNLCEKTTERFWFNLFHELAHIVLGHLEKEGGLSSEDEKCADKYASEIL